MTDEEDDDIVLTPLCAECVRDLPVDGSQLCAFCAVVTEEVQS